MNHPTVTIADRTIPVSGFTRVKDEQGETIGFLPVIDTMTDSQWIISCIESRQQHPENYPNEDIPAVIAQQLELLERVRERQRREAAPPSPRGYAFIEIP